MLDRYIKLNDLGGEYAELYESIREGAPCSAFGLQKSEKCHIASFLDLPTVYIAQSVIACEKIANEIWGLTGVKPIILYPKNEVLLYRKAFNREYLYKRLQAIYEIKNGDKSIVVTTMESLLQLFPKEIGSIKLKKGGEYYFEDVLKSLVDLGYRREEQASQKGSFAFRGDILDVFPINSDEPIRFDFFGDEIENIKTIDVGTNAGVANIDDALIISATDVTIRENEKNDILEKLKTEFLKIESPIARVRARVILDELIESLESGDNSGYSDFLLPLTANATDNFFDIFNYEKALIVYDEGKILYDNLEMLWKEHKERFESLKKSGEVFGFSFRQFCEPENLIDNLRKKRNLCLQNLTAPNKFFNPLKIFRFSSSTVPKYTMHKQELFVDLKNWLKCGYRIIICCTSFERAQLMLSSLSEQKIFCGQKDDFPEDFQGIMLTTFTLDEGFIYHDNKLVVIGSGDVYITETREKKLKKRRDAMFTAPTVNDYAVHETHGIGIVRGTKLIESTSGTKEYIAVEYGGGDILYVSVEQMDKLTRYLGGEEKPHLNKIGGKEFEKVKERVRESIAKMSINLKALYRERAEQKGFKFSPDDELATAFDAAFEFEETEDQAASEKEIKADMESGKVMDRLLCGDVGFGKTEVALRAAFKAVIDGKQVAIIAPTTILSEQHYNTALNRFKGFGVRIALINRFRNAAQQAKIIETLANGETDIIIGTHRLFGKDIKFKDLGLLILDEEQRFGVEHKEKIKVLKKDVDTLTLTATPIPRTLHMSLTGIRDISTINTPPKERIPVQTEVVEETDALLKDAIIREISRDGQVFVLYNRVESIYSFASNLQTLVPEAKIIVAHGQMPEKSLENSIKQFYDGEGNVLVSTTIIENGIDLPRANTIIVTDADRLGLSTLYQLKGRVGRSNRLAHAYFTYKPDKVLTETAYKRLEAIMEFTEMGSGFKLAMRDLEIRGAGNVLGREQHGHMEKVGYELYSKLLKEQLGEDVKETEVEADVKTTAYIPKNYIQNQSARMDVYKQIAEIRDGDDSERIKDGLKDVYGEVPQEVENLIEIAQLKVMVKAVKGESVTVSKKTTEILFGSISALNNAELLDALERNKKEFLLAVGEKPSIKYIGANENVREKMRIMTEFLSFQRKKIKMN